MTAWDASTTVYTDYSTPDIGSSTAGISFTTSTNGTSVFLNAVVTSGTWTIKVGTRVIF
jgi:hypothetical protein